MSHSRFMQIEPNKPFPWPKGLRLVPTEDVIILLPGGLIENDELISTVVEVSNDAEAEIGFKPSAQPSGSFEAIILKVAKGNGIRLNRGTQAMVIRDFQRPVSFEIDLQT